MTCGHNRVRCARWKGGSNRLRPDVWVTSRPARTIRIQAAFHIERRSQWLKHLLFELHNPVWGAEIGQGNPNRQSRITEGAEEAHVE
jgi:hypothetical protein